MCSLILNRYFIDLLTIFIEIFYTKHLKKYIYNPRTLFHFDNSPDQTETKNDSAESGGDGERRAFPFLGIRNYRRGKIHLAPDNDEKFGILFPDVLSIIFSAKSEASGSGPATWPLLGPSSAMRPFVVSSPGSKEVIFVTRGWGLDVCRRQGRMCGGAGAISGVSCVEYGRNLICIDVI